MFLVVFRLRIWRQSEPNVCEDMDSSPGGRTLIRIQILLQQTQLILMTCQQYHLQQLRMLLLCFASRYRVLSTISARLRSYRSSPSSSAQLFLLSNSFSIVRYFGIIQTRTRNQSYFLFSSSQDSSSMFELVAGLWRQASLGSASYSWKMPNLSQMVSAWWMFWLILMKYSRSLEGSAVWSCCRKYMNSSLDLRMDRQANLKKSGRMSSSCARRQQSFRVLASPSHRSLIQVCRLNLLARMYLFLASMLPFTSPLYFSIISLMADWNLNPPLLMVVFSSCSIYTMDLSTSQDNVWKSWAVGPRWRMLDILGLNPVKMSRMVYWYSLLSSSIRLKLVSTHNLMLLRYVLTKNRRNTKLAKKESQVRY